MMFELGSFNLINEFERASNEPNAEQLASSSAQLQLILSLSRLICSFTSKLVLFSFTSIYSIYFSSTFIYQFLHLLVIS